MNLPEAIKKYKEKTGESIPDIATKTGIPEANLYKWQNGTKPTNLEHYNKLVAYMKGKIENVPHGTISAAEHIATLKDHNETLKRVILENLTAVQSSLKTNQIMIRSIQVQQTAQHEVMLGSLDRLENETEGTLAAKAGKREFELNGQVNEIDKRSTEGSMNRQGA